MEKVMVGNEIVELVEKNGGWTTIKNRAGEIKKVRNSAIKEVPTFHQPTITEADLKADLETVEQNRASVEEIVVETPVEEPAPTTNRGIIRANLSQYVKGLGQTEKGHDTLDIDDEVAQVLRGCSLDELYTTATVLMVEKGYQVKGMEYADPGTLEILLRQKYGHLNPGQQRMVIGNRLRKAFKSA